MPIEIKLPSLGDQIDSGDVLEVKVHVGDVIQKDQGIVELETDKATVEVPSTHAGKVLKIHVKDGQTIKIGAALITLEETAVSAAAPATPAKPAKQAASAKAPEPKPAQSSQPTVTPVVSSPPKVLEPVAVPSPVAKTPAASTSVTAASASSNPSASKSDQSASATSETIAAGPAVRRFAREVGVDLMRVTGSGTGGRITRDDILAVVRQANEVARNRGPAPATPLAEVSEMDPWGPVRFEKMTKIRKTIAAKMSESWSTAPRVTNFDDADVTELEHIRQSSKSDYAANGIKLTALPFVAKAVAMSLKKHPTVNASLDAENERVIYKNYVSIGIAVDTDRGLVVPVLRDADKLSISEIARTTGQHGRKSPHRQLLD